MHLEPCISNLKEERLIPFSVPWLKLPFHLKHLYPLTVWQAHPFRLNSSITPLPNTFSPAPPLAALLLHAPTISCTNHTPILSLTYCIYPSCAHHPC